MFKNCDINDNFNILGSNNMTPITENKSNNMNPYSKTLWQNGELNKITVDKYKIDGPSNIKRRLTEKRKQQNLSLILNNKSNKNLIIQQDLTSFYSPDHIEPLYLSANSDKKKNSTAEIKILDVGVNINVSPSPILSNNTDINQKTKTFLKTLETFYNYEVDYVKQLEIVITVFKAYFKKSSKLKTKLESMNTQNNDCEMLIFGNIETMIELSNIFLKRLLLFLSEFFNVNKNDQLFWQIIRKQTIISDIKSLKIIQFLNQEFIKWKYTYKSYLITHERQINYLNHLMAEEKTKVLMTRWLQKCESNISFRFADENDCFSFLLRQLIKPKQRVKTWVSFIDASLPMVESVLSIDSYDICLRLQKDLYEYCKNLKQQEMFYTKTKRISVTDCFPIPKPIDITTSYTSSDTSSVYSEYLPNLVQDDYKTSSIKEKTKLDSATSFNSFTIQNSKKEHYDIDNKVNYFLKTKTHLLKLEEAISKISFSDLVVRLHTNTKKWKSVYTMGQILDEHSVNIYELYQQKLETQLIHTSKLENVELQIIIKNIKQCLTYFNIIENIIIERGQLIKQIKETKKDNIQYNAVSNQIDHLTDTLNSDLSKFQDIFSVFVTLINSKVNEICLRFFEIMVGNTKYLNEFVSKFESKTIEFGDNFDIIQQFNYSKENNKRVLQEYSNSIHSKTKYERVYVYSKTFKYFFG